jgi:hypothetical protein
MMSCFITVTTNVICYKISNFGILLLVRSCMKTSSASYTLHNTRTMLVYVLELCLVNSFAQCCFVIVPCKQTHCCINWLGWPRKCANYRYDIICWLALMYIYSKCNMTLLSHFRIYEQHSNFMLLSCIWKWYEWGSVHPKYLSTIFLLKDIYSLLDCW